MATKKQYGGVSLPLIEEGDDKFDTTVGRRGLPDVVSPVMDELVADMVASGTTVVQMKADDPFTISQLRYWQPKGAAKLPENMKLSVSGGIKGRNISITVQERKDDTNGVSNGDAPVRRKPAKRAVAKKAPARRKTVAKADA